MTEQALLDAIRQAHAPDNDDRALTASEIQEATGMGINQVRAKLKALVAQDKVAVTWVYRDTLTTPLTGRMAKVPGYVARDMGQSGTMAAGVQSVAG